MFRNEMKHTVLFNLHSVLHFLPKKKGKETKKMREGGNSVGILQQGQCPESSGSLQFWWGDRNMASSRSNHFRRYFQMTMEMFEILLGMVAPYICRKPIYVEWDMTWVRCQWVLRNCKFDAIAASLFHINYICIEVQLLGNFKPYVSLTRLFRSCDVVLSDKIGYCVTKLMRFSSF